MNANFIATADALGLSREELVELARNSFTASFVTDEEQRPWLAELDSVAAQ
jgi:adenosine deaminase